MKQSSIYLAMAISISICVANAYAHSDSKDAHESASHATKGHSSGYHRKFNDAKHWVKVFDDPERDKWQLPAKVIEVLKVKPNDVVADIGAGTGYFTFRIAKAQPQAKIFAADIEKDMLAFIADESKRQGCKNVVPLEIKTAKPELPEKPNLVLIVDTFHHIDDRIQYFKDLKRSLSPDCRLVIIDFTDKSPVGPPKDHRINKKEVIAEFKESGFALSDEQSILPYQYYLEFRAKSK